MFNKLFTASSTMKILQMEEEFIEKMCNEVIAVKPDLVITEKGVSDLAQHYLIKAGITCIRRVRKSDNNRIARACGATVVNRTDEIKEEDVGTECGLFEVRKFGDEYFTFLTECKNPKACTILLRGASKDILNEVERNLQDAMNVARNVMQEPYLVPGGGAAEKKKTPDAPRYIISGTGGHLGRITDLPQTVLEPFTPINLNANITMLPRF